MRRVAAFIAAVLCAAAPAAVAAAYPPVVDIRVAGDAVTQRSVLLREMALGLGDPADPARVAASRQALLDLELFRDVTIHEVPEDGGVALVIELAEKRFLIALPRLDSSSDGDLSYGAQMRWNNVFGLNHTFDLRFERGEYPGDRLREEERSARMRYTAPFVRGRHGWHGEVEFIERAAPVPGGTFDERIRRAQLLFTHDHRDTRPRRGWITTTGVQWIGQHADGALAPPSDGRATALVVGATYADVRHHVFSETGRQLVTRLEWAYDGLLSDYGYRKVDAYFVEHIGLPHGAHHTLNLIGAAGWHGGGPGRVSAYGLGGSSALRGYDLDFLEGDRYAYTAAEYLRPLFGRDWLRLLLVAETGVTGGGIPGSRAGGPYASVGAGVRVRVTWFMSLEFEAGLAYPLRGGDGLQFFGGSR